ncbi:MAG: hypothetical protein JKY27_04050 [Magnetovibrio sp.]|nr:hypothetical protein [Magnetovibrio sp.]
MSEMLLARCAQNAFIAPSLLSWGSNKMTHLMKFKIAFGLSVLMCATVVNSAVAAPDLAAIYNNISQMTLDQQRELMVNELGEGTGQIAYLAKDKYDNDYVLKVCIIANNCVKQLRDDANDNNIIKGHFSFLFADAYPTDPNMFAEAFLFPCAGDKTQVACRISVETFVNYEQYDISGDFVPAVREVCLWKLGKTEEEFKEPMMSKIRPVIERRYKNVRSIDNGQSFALMSSLLRTWNHVFEDIQGGFLPGNVGFVGYDTGAIADSPVNEKNCQINWICGVAKEIASFYPVQQPCSFIQNTN